MDIIFARQPILNSFNELYGYELLFRGNALAVESGAVGGASFDGEKATAYILEVLSSLSIMEITGGARAFVNFTDKLILDGYATLFPPEYLVIEVLETTNPTPELIETLAQLKELGYKIALDDFVYDPKYKELIELADIFKVEIGMDQKSVDNLFRVLRLSDTKKCTILAERVETKEVFDACTYAGCKLFQGYYFAKPVTISKPSIEMNRVNYIRLITFVNTKDVRFDEISKVIKNDVALTYKLLTLVNSVYYSRGNRISDIHQAVVMLGLEDLKKWVSFISLNNMCSDKPSELVKMSIVRANFCSDMAVITGNQNIKEYYFLVGIFSLLEAMMDTEIQTVLSNVNVPDEVKDALAGLDNDLSRMLNVIKVLEIGNLDMVEVYGAELKCENDDIMNAYLNSIKVCNDLL
ncbi:MAG: HDOD domain-containing protein [Eubacterium sp.]|jgi:EAL and modified HD-GYP domain-containing signal transduction protein|nr:HDOD domain-containing protein [Eubacterium sp.]